MPEVKELSAKKVRKNIYWKKLETMLSSYKNILVITVDFVGSRQMQTVRAKIRGRGEVLMGKNTIIRKVIREKGEENPALLDLLPLIKGNMGFIFTNGDLAAIRKEVIAEKMPAAAKAGVIAPCDVTIPAGPTGLDPGQTTFFQTLNIATKITRGTIEITTAVPICFKGTKVTTSAVALLAKMGVRPFEYGIEVTHVYENGSVYSADVLDLSMDDLVAKFCNCVARVSAISFELGEVNTATIPHSFGRVFNMLAAIGLEAEYDFEEMAAVKLAMAGGGGGGNAAAAETATVAPVVVEEEEEEQAPAVDMFGGGDDEEGDY